ncbi:hypothetical protein MIND_00179500 [Mycena indigotica]|uniref:Uncharacterized protein n=1 Tax=Mycena indigotica TaxID=2126181 RepID=A0A8H6T851_9AGAR|nr:uncharacterized protein MIND_00179500 [Mycena indigotica]KAF7311697.1 hypothetical protein MIND_00179500 [Mycena indigotica]
MLPNGPVTPVGPLDDITQAFVSRALHTAFMSDPPIDVFILAIMALFRVIALANGQNLAAFPVLVNATSLLNLATLPFCGSLNSSTFAELNTGIDLNAIRTVVTFGDSWTSTGSNGTIPFPPILHPPLPSAGSRTSQNRRASNGFMWNERLAMDLNAKLLDYAWGGAVIDNFAYNTTTPLNKTAVQRSDFVSQTKLFFLQGKFLDLLSPASTLYSVAFGIKGFDSDDGQYKLAGGDIDLAINTYTTKLAELQSNGARNILIHGMYTSHPETDLLQAAIFDYLRSAHSTNGTDFAFVDLHTLFAAISTAPADFGYTGNATCLVSPNTIVGGCVDPERTVFYIPGHPSMQTHGLINDYTQRVLNGVCGCVGASCRKESFMDPNLGASACCGLKLDTPCVVLAPKFALHMSVLMSAVTFKFAQAYILRLGVPHRNGTWWKLDVETV